MCQMEAVQYHLSELSRYYYFFNNEQAVLSHVQSVPVVVPVLAV